MLGEAAAFGVDALRQDLVAHLRRGPRASGRPGPRDRAALDRAHHPVEGHPDHHPGVGEVPRLAADLPDAVVGLLPGRPAPRRACAAATRCPRLSESPAARAAASATITSPNTSVCRCPTAPLPIRTGGSRRSRRGGRAPARGGHGAPSTAYMICRSLGSPAIARSSQLAPQLRLVAVAERPAARPGSARRPAASRSGSPSCGCRRSPRAATWSGRRRCRRPAVGEHPQREQRADDRLAVGALVAAPAGPRRVVARSPPSASRPRSARDRQVRGDPDEWRTSGSHRRHVELVDVPTVRRRPGVAVRAGPAGRDPRRRRSPRRRGCGSRRTHGRILP